MKRKPQTIHNGSLSKFLRIGSIQDEFSEDSGVKLELNKRKITRKSLYTWKLGNKLVNNHWVKEKNCNGSWKIF